ncbi:alpha-L-rhamnosidase C-terminal domain-containing protein [Microbacterium phosphatis]|uniref:alpha-L-rhamnosidase C-terminal domain-containing protein n=1 Tax=Microbacterium phosphatis TaxID=3140248 RepID=UPI00314099AE
MHRTIGGLTATEPGYRRMRIAPLPGGGLTSASLRHTTTFGDVTVSWSLSGITMSVEVTIPEGTDATVVLPQHPAGETHEIGAGAHRWTYEIPAHARARSFSLDSTLKELADHPAAWRAFTEAFAVHFPGVPLDGSAPEAAFMSVATMLEYVPGASDALGEDLAAALAGVSEGVPA